MNGNRTASGDMFDPKAFTAAHRTLPLGSFVEVTSLASGRTILVEVNDRGPGDRGLLIDLSSAAAKELGVAGRDAVRVRRVTPMPDDYAAIRAGRPGAPRLDTPPILLAGLKQELVSMPAPAAPRLARPVIAPDPKPILTAGADPKPATPTVTQPIARPVASLPTVGPGYSVQIATFSSQPRATTIARSLGGDVQPAGKLWRVRLGPYPTAAQAKQARDGAARRGYGDARVVRDD